MFTTVSFKSDSQDKSEKLENVASEEKLRFGDTSHVVNTATNVSHGWEKIPAPRGRRRGRTMHEAWKNLYNDEPTEVQHFNQRRDLEVQLFTISIYVHYFNNKSFIQ